MTTTTGDAIAEQVYRIIAMEVPIGYETAEKFASRRPFLNGEELSPWEWDLRAWGIAFGAAYALAKLEAGPFATPNEVGERALGAATASWARYGSFSERPAGFDEATRAQAAEDGGEEGD